MDAETLLDCSVCLESIPPEEGKGEVTDYVAHYCGLACYERWHDQALHAPDEVVSKAGAMQSPAA